MREGKPEPLIAAPADWGPEPFPIESCKPVEKERWKPSGTVPEHQLQPYWPAAAAAAAAAVAAVAAAVSPVTNTISDKSSNHPIFQILVIPTYYGLYRFF